MLKYSPMYIYVFSWKESGRGGGGDFVSIEKAE